MRNMRLITNAQWRTKGKWRQGRRRWPSGDLRPKTSDTFGLGAPKPLAPKATTPPPSSSNCLYATFNVYEYWTAFKYLDCELSRVDFVGTI
ncbi:hypothetical protein CHS0354_004258 [Potamilus streckersoni]|uniref:Uncharacterized protein n=1 Tax=Potamilus streckersoni TaxID=2493646 RepID=A0AAE0VNT8_9BIVA|nr:hypothetical protein CHS0354_004258 [Potamilus streckersoni]